MEQYLTEEDKQFLREKFGYSFENDSKNDFNRIANNILIAFYQTYGIDVSSKLSEYKFVKIESEPFSLQELLDNYGLLHEKKEKALENYTSKFLRSSSGVNKNTSYSNIFEDVKVFFDYVNEKGIDSLSYYGIYKDLDRKIVDRVINFITEIVYVSKSKYCDYDGINPVMFVKYMKANPDLFNYFYYKYNGYFELKNSPELNADLEKTKEIINKLFKVYNIQNVDLDVLISKSDYEIDKIEEEYKNGDSMFGIKSIISSINEELKKHVTLEDAKKISEEYGERCYGGIAFYGKLLDGKSELVSSVLLSYDQKKNIRTSAHENNHTLESKILYEDENCYVKMCGWVLSATPKKEYQFTDQDILDIEEFKIYHRDTKLDDFSILYLTKAKGFLPYNHPTYDSITMWRFNEVINDRITIDAYETITGEKYFSEFRGDNNYSRCFSFVEEFYQKYKKDIIISRQDGNIDHIISLVGKDNFYELSRLVDKYYRKTNAKSPIEFFMDKTDYEEEMKKLMHKMDMYRMSNNRDRSY